MVQSVNPPEAVESTLQLRNNSGLSFTKPGEGEWIRSERIII